MAILSWIICILSLLAGAALWLQPALPAAGWLAAICFGMAVFALPPLWMRDGEVAGLTLSERLFACVALLLSMPIAWLS